MALLQYRQHKDSLPDPKCSPTFAIPAQAMALANQEMQAAMEKDIQVREGGNKVHTITIQPQRLR